MINLTGDQLLKVGYELKIYIKIVNEFEVKKFQLKIQMSRF